jgi:3',5'-cyclic AMP phosphodiesterase CpdA
MKDAPRGSTTTTVILLILGIIAVAVFWAVSSRRPGDVIEGPPVNAISGQATNTAAVATAEAVPDVSVILGRPTNSSISLNILPKAGAELSVLYGTAAGAYDQRSASVPSKAGIPVEIELAGLKADTQYYYTVQFAAAKGHSTAPILEGKFHTARPSGSAFTFAVEADPHLDRQSDPAVFRQCLSNILADSPDFLIDLGDAFMTDQLPQKSAGTILGRYLLMRNYFGRIGHSVPFLLAPGNHDGEAGWDFSGGSDLAKLSRQDRLSYFSVPHPDGFFGGNSRQEDGRFVGDYYSFAWGDALLVVLDPYRYTLNKPNADGWAWTLGKEQYDWLKETLEKSGTRFKFIFIHQLVGGDGQGRGGVEFAKLYEWGGNNADGSYGFDAQRPGWGRPIHQLLVDNGVNAVFKGHDHFFAKQELDGVIYQTLPQPSHPGDKVDTAEEYGYRQGEVLGGSGYLRVAVSGEKTSVQFIKADKAREAAYTYEIK